MLTKKQLIDFTLASFEAERRSDPQTNAKLLHKSFAVTDMVLANDKTYLPRLSGPELHKLINKAFQICGREFVFKTIMADEQIQTVIVEFIESYPDPITQQVYRTPQVAICVFKDGKLFRTRHYMDPRLSLEHLTPAIIDTAFE